VNRRATVRSRRPPRRSDRPGRRFHDGPGPAATARTVSIPLTGYRHRQAGRRRRTIGPRTGRTDGDRVRPSHRAFGTALGDDTPVVPVPVSATGTARPIHARRCVPRAFTIVPDPARCRDHGRFVAVQLVTSGEWNRSAGARRRHPAGSPRGPRGRCGDDASIRRLARAPSGGSGTVVSRRAAARTPRSRRADRDPRSGSPHPRLRGHVPGAGRSWCRTFGDTESPGGSQRVTTE
jgi:hypothetical protein